MHIDSIKRLIKGSKICPYASDYEIDTMAAFFNNELQGLKQTLGLPEEKHDTLCLQTIQQLAVNTRPPFHNLLLVDQGKAIRNKHRALGELAPEQPLFHAKKIKPRNPLNPKILVNIDFRVM